VISNCLIESIKGFYKNKEDLYLIIPKVKNERGVPHFIWREKGVLKHYTFLKKNKNKMKHWYNFILFNGEIKKFPRKFLKNVKLKKIL
jgi:hypothetical protein